MSEEVEGPAGGGSAGESTDEAAARIWGLAPGEQKTALSEMVRKRGVDSVPLLERLAQGTGGISNQAIHALGGLKDAIAASALDRIAATAVSSALRKEARRELHKLASLGVKASTGEATLAPVASPRDDAYMSLVSPIDGAGNRGIWLAFRRGADVDFVSVLASDEEGVKDIFVRESSLTRFQREARKVQQDPEFPWIDIPIDYARHLLDTVHRQNAVSGTSLPLEFVAWRERIARPTQPEQQPIIYSVLSAAEVRWEPRYLDNSGSLYELDLFRGWIFEKDEIGEFVREKMSAERSGLLIAGAGGETRDRMIEAAAIQRLFDARRRSLLKGRLEEMAYLLWRLGRLEASRSALAAALALLPTDRPLTDHPFVKQMIHWSLEIVSELIRTERTRAIRPGIQLHLP